MVPHCAAGDGVFDNPVANIPDHQNNPTGLGKFKSVAEPKIPVGVLSYVVIGAGVRVGT